MYELFIIIISFSLWTLVGSIWPQLPGHVSLKYPRHGSVFTRCSGQLLGSCNLENHVFQCWEFSLNYFIANSLLPIFAILFFRDIPIIWMLDFQCLLFKLLSLCFGLCALSSGTCAELYLLTLLLSF